MIPWESSETTAKIIPAFVAALAATGDVVKDGKVKVATKTGGTMEYGYATLGAVLDALKPVLTSNGLGVSQSSSDNGVQTILLHESGEWLAFPPLNIHTGQNTPQAQGSAISFARRYSLLAAFNIATEDDDAKAASKPRRATAPNPAPTADDAYPAAAIGHTRAPFDNSKPTDSQRAKAMALANELGIKDTRLDYWSGWLERKVGSFNDLTRKEAGVVIDRMEAMSRNGAGAGAARSTPDAPSPVSDTGAGAPHEALTGADAQ